MFDGAGSVADWVGGLAGAAGLILSVIVGVISKRADDKASAERAEQEVKLEEHRVQLRKLEQERATREIEMLNLQKIVLQKAEQRDELDRAMPIAKSVTARWVKRNADGHWGILVENTGEGTSVLRNIRIETTTRPGFEKFPILRKELAKGCFFFESIYDSQKWKDPVRGNDLSEFTDIGNSQQYGVTSFAFSDGVGNRWCLDAQGILAPCSTV